MIVGYMKELLDRIPKLSDEWEAALEQDVRCQVESRYAQNEFVELDCERVLMIKILEHHITAQHTEFDDRDIYRAAKTALNNIKGRKS